MSNTHPLPDEENRRIIELQSEVISMRRCLPKIYYKLLKVEYKNFLNTLRNGTCTIPAHLQDVPLIVNADAMVRQHQQIEELQRRYQTPALPMVCRTADQVVSARLMLRRMRRKSTNHSVTTTAASRSNIPAATNNKTTSECV